MQAVVSTSIEVLPHSPNLTDTYSLDRVIWTSLEVPVRLRCLCVVECIRSKP